MKTFVKKYSALFVILGLTILFAAQIELFNAKFKKAGWALGGLIIVGALIMSGGHLENEMSDKTLADNGNKTPSAET